MERSAGAGNDRYFDRRKAMNDYFDSKNRIVIRFLGANDIICYIYFLMVSTGGHHPAFLASDEAILKTPCANNGGLRLVISQSSDIETYLQREPSLK